MQIILVIVLSLHIFSGIFWAGSTFVLTRNEDATLARRLFRPQMGAAGTTVVAGAALGWLVHRYAFGLPEKLLLLGALSAIAALLVQAMLVGGALRRQASGSGDETGVHAGVAKGHRIAAGLLAIAILCMAAARYA